MKLIDAFSGRISLLFFCGAAAIASASSYWALFSWDVFDFPGNFAFSDGAFYVGRAFAALLLIVFPLQLARKSRSTLAAATAVYACASLMPFLAASASGFAWALSTVGSFMLGASYDILLALLCLKLARELDFRWAIATVAAGFIAGLWLQHGLYLIESRHVGAPASALVLPAAIGVAVALALRDEGGSSRMCCRAGLPGRMRFYLLAQGIVATFLTLVVHLITPQRNLISASKLTQISGRPIDDPLAMAAFNLVAAILAALLLARQAERPLVSRFVPPIAFVGACVVLVLSLWIADIWNPSRVIRGCLLGVQYFSHIVQWAVCMTLMGRSERQGYRLTGVVLCAQSLCWLLAPVVFSTLRLEEGVAAVLFAICSLIALVALVLPAILFRSSRGDGVEALAKGARLQGETRSGDLEYVDELEEAIDRRGRFLAARYGLSRREADVFLELCHERSRPVICEKLYLSDSTVKTHVSHIYRKFNVKGAQELLDVFFGEGLPPDSEQN